MQDRTKVLLVDDEPFIMGVVSKVLDAAGFDVATCGEWTAVARAVRLEKPDLVLLDYNMPGIKGDEMCRILKRNSNNVDLRIVIFSSESETDLVDISRSCGANGFIPKNAPVHELVAHVRLLADTSARCV